MIQVKILEPRRIASKVGKSLGKDKIDLAVLTFCSKETLDFAIKVVKKSGEIRLTFQHKLDKPAVKIILKNEALGVS
jgi:hypothetical protein